MKRVLILISSVHLFLAAPAAHCGLGAFFAMDSDPCSRAFEDVADAEERRVPIAEFDSRRTEDQERVFEKWQGDFERRTPTKNWVQAGPVHEVSHDPTITYTEVSYPSHLTGRSAAGIFVGQDGVLRTFSGRVETVEWDRAIDVPFAKIKNWNGSLVSVPIRGMGSRLRRMKVLRQLMPSPREAIPGDVHSLAPVRELSAVSRYELEDLEIRALRDYSRLIENSPSWRSAGKVTNGPRLADPHSKNPLIGSYVEVQDVAQLRGQVVAGIYIADKKLLVFAGKVERVYLHPEAHPGWGFYYAEVRTSDGTLQTIELFNANLRRLSFYEQR